MSYEAMGENPGPQLFPTSTIKKSERPLLPLCHDRRLLTVSNTNLFGPEAKVVTP